MRNALLFPAAAARRECQLTGKVANNGYNVTFSHKRNKKLQGVNLQEKKVYWPAKQRWITLKLSTKVGPRPCGQAATPPGCRCTHSLFAPSCSAWSHRCAESYHRVLMRRTTATQAIKTIEKKGLEVMAKEAGLDLNSLPFRCQLYSLLRTAGLLCCLCSPSMLPTLPSDPSVVIKPLASHACRDCQLRTLRGTDC